MSALLRLVFQARRKTGGLDLEAVEMALRAAMHRAGAATLTQLLRLEPPDEDHMEVPCSCGRTARFKEMRAKSFLSVLGTVEVRRPYYPCSHCSHGQHPVDGELGIAGLESSPGVRRMESMLGAEMPDHGRRQLCSLSRISWAARFATGSAGVRTDEGAGGAGSPRQGHRTGR